MKHNRVAAASFAAVLGPLAGFAASLAGALPARGVDVRFTEHVISTTADRAFSVFATDLDGDGDTDVLSASQDDNKIAWYESDGGSPPTFTERVISTAAIGARSVFATDVDGDGDIDVLSASYDDDKIAWYESDGGSPPTFTERVISTTAERAFSVFATDVDGDGDTDILSASIGDDKIAWYESDGGSPPTFTERVISTTAAGADSVFAIDLDGDGDIDVLSASGNDDKIAWYESDGGSPPTFTERVISTNAVFAFSVFASDLDGDGDTDVLSASLIDNKIAWYENDGGSPPTFTERVISTATNVALSVFATDVDGDGDIDVLSASQRDDKIAWYENTTCGDGAAEGTEECDDGLDNSDTEPDACRTDCRTASCGDGVNDTGDECDDGLDNSDTEPNACRTDCTTASCGDGVVDTGEECDDGNLDGGDLCSGQCVIEGACCDRGPGVGGLCAVTLQEDCVDIQWVWSRGASCAEALCEEGTGSCCNSDAGPLATQGICTGNVLQSDCDCETCTWTKDALCSNVDCPADVISIPAVSEWGLVITTLLFLIGSKMVWRRRTT